MANNKEILNVRNARGILIKMWCGSCQHKSVDAADIRSCSLTKRPVLCTSMCKKWELKEALLSAGNGGGRVKCLEYLMYVRDKRLEEQELIAQGVITSKQQMPCRESRRRFNKEHAKGIYAIK